MVRLEKIDRVEKMKVRISFRITRYFKNFFTYIVKYVKSINYFDGYYNSKSEEFNVKLCSFDKQDLITIQTKTDKYGPYYVVSINEPLALDETLYKQTLFFGIFFPLLHPEKFADMFKDTKGPTKDIIGLENIKIKPLKEILMHSRYKTVVHTFDPEKNTFDIELGFKEFLSEKPDHDIKVRIQSGFGMGIESASIYFLNIYNILGFNLIKDGDRHGSDFLKSKHLWYFSFILSQVMYDVMDTTAREYPLFQSIFTYFETEIRQKRIENIVNYVSDEVRIFLDLKENIQKHKFINKMLEHFSDYEINGKWDFRHRSIELPVFGLSEEYFILHSLKNNYMKFNIIMNDIFSFYKKHVGDVERPLFSSGPFTSKIEQRTSIFVRNSPVFTSFLTKKGFLYDLTTKTYKKEEKFFDSGYTLQMEYNILDQMLKYKFIFYINKVIEESAGAPATYIYKIVKKEIDELPVKEMLKHITMDDVKFFPITYKGGNLKR